MVKLSIEMLPKSLLCSSKQLTAPSCLLISRFNTQKRTSSKVFSNTSCVFFLFFVRITMKTNKWKIETFIVKLKAIVLNHTPSTCTNDLMAQATERAIFRRTAWTKATNERIHKWIWWRKWRKKNWNMPDFIRPIGETLANHRRQTKTWANRRTQ